MSMILGRLNYRKISYRGIKIICQIPWTDLRRYCNEAAIWHEEKIILCLVVKVKRVERRVERRVKNDRNEREENN